MATTKEVLITEIEEFDSVEVVEVLVKEGDQVEVDQPLVTIESEKAMMDFPSPFKGIVQKINVKEGSQVKEGDSLVTLEAMITQEEGSVQTQKAKEVNIEEKHPEVIIEDSKQISSQNLSQEKTISVSTNRSNKVAYASPSVSKYARELGVDLTAVSGSGRQQRIIQEDIQNYVRNHLNINQSLHSGSALDVKPLDLSSYGEIEKKPLTKIQKITAKNMLNAWQSIPHVTHFDQADVTQLEQHRKQLAQELKEKNIKLTPLAFVIKALVTTLKAFPQFNTSLDLVTEELIFKKYFHIGIAVDTPHGLLVPVIRDVDKKTIAQVAVELMELSDSARQRKLTLKQMSGASMTISSLGVLGGQAFTPIINPPEVAILGLSKMSVAEIPGKDGVEQQKLLPLSLSYDHRVINGADAARFCSYLIHVLEDIWKLIL